MSRAILGYLKENPNAEDTVEGVVEWWLLQQRIKYEVTNVHDALTYLVGKGFVIEREGRDKRPHYRMNEARLSEIDLMLSGSGKKSKPAGRRAKSYREDS